MPLPKPPSCSGCPLEKLGSGFTLPSGSGASKLLVVGEAPGAEEARLGVPFVGAAGFFLDRLLKRAGINRDDLLIDNTIRCRPPQNALRGASYEFGAIAHCRPHLDQTIRSLQPRAIVALGGTALARLTGESSIMRARGYVLDGPAGPDGTPIPVIGTYHPAYLMPRQDRAESAKDKNPWRLCGIAILDLRFAERIAREGFARTPVRYLCDPDQATIHDFIREYERSGAPLSVDIETPGKLKELDEEELDYELLDQPIIRIGFSFKPGYALSIPWNESTLPFIRRLCGSAGDKVVWNGYSFDAPLLARHGAPLNGVIHDAMWAWHILQSDLPRGLEFVGGVYARDLRPWKHLSDAEPARYNAQDADVALRNFLGIREDLQVLSQWELYENHVVRLVPILQLAGRNGIHIDTAAQAELRRELESEIAALQAQIDTVVPRELRSRKRYVKPPSNPEGWPVEEVTTFREQQVCNACGEVASSRSEHLRGGKRSNPCARSGAGFRREVRPTTVWDVILPFNVLGDDLERYVRHHGHPMGRNPKNGAETLDKKTLEKLAKKYPKHVIYGHALRVREIRKVLGTFLYQPSADGLLHTEYTLAPSTGRLSSRNPNLQNVTHGGANRYADAIRRTLVPPPGHLFVEADSSAIEAVMSGFFMGDPFYIELAQKGIHDYLTCLELGLPFEPAQFDAYKKDPAYKKARERNKRIVHGTAYGMSFRLMAQLYPEIFPTERDAREAQQRYFDACPKLPEWHHTTRMTAHRQGYLTNPWGRRHYFWHVFSRDRSGKIRIGEDGKACIAFLPQSSAADFQQDNALLLAEQIQERELPFIIPANFLVHDSYCLAVPERYVDDAAALLRGVLTRPIPQMDGLTIGCEVKVGPNWADMETLQ